MKSMIDLNELIQSIKIYESFVKKDTMDKGERWIKIEQRNIKSGKGRNLLVLGEPGSGKSWACLRMAELLDLNGFTSDKIAFTERQFLELVMNSKKGDCIVYEEVGVNISNRTWWLNKGQNSLVQTMRHKNLFVILNCPNQDFVDNQIRKLVHYSFGMQTLNIKEGYSIMRPMRLETDGQFGRTMTKYPYIDGKLIKQFKVLKPTIQVRHAYERMAMEFKNKLNEKLLKEQQSKDDIKMDKQKQEQPMVIARGG